MAARVNDFVEFVSPKHDKDKFNEHINTFIKEHGFSDDYEEDFSISALNARSLLISFGTK